MRTLLTIVSVLTAHEFHALAGERDLQSREYAITIESGTSTRSDMVRDPSREIGVLFARESWRNVLSSRAIGLHADASLNLQEFASQEVRMVIGSRSTHVSREWSIVRRIPGKVRKLRVMKRASTSIVLEWSAPEDSLEIVGYRVYRAPGGRRPINGKEPIAEVRFVDIGLSANRVYAYEVCAVSANGIEGERERIETSTLVHQNR